MPADRNEQIRGESREICRDAEAHYEGHGVYIKS